MSKYNIEEQFAIDNAKVSCFGCSDPYHGDEVINDDAAVLRYVIAYCNVNDVEMPAPTPEYIAYWEGLQEQEEQAPAVEEPATPTEPAEPAKAPTEYQIWQAACKARKDAIEEANETWKSAVAERKQAIEGWDGTVKKCREILDAAKAVPTPDRPAPAKKKAPAKSK